MSNNTQTTPKTQRGRWQAQGHDIDRRQKGGVSVRWAQDVSPSHADGSFHIDKLELLCERRELAVRAGAIDKARRFLARHSGPKYLDVSLGGPVTRTFRTRGLDDSTIRVDLELREGQAWT